MFEVAEVALDPCDARRVRLLLAQPREPRSVFRFEPIEASAPAVLAADHRGLDQELLPPPRRAECALDHRVIVGVRLRHGTRIPALGRRAFGLRVFGDRAVSRRPQRLVLGRRPHRAIHWRRAGCVERRHLPQREVLREPPRREPLQRAVEQRQERAA